MEPLVRSGGYIVVKEKKLNNLYCVLLFIAYLIVLVLLFKVWVAVVMLVIWKMIGLLSWLGWIDI